MKNFHEQKNIYNEINFYDEKNVYDELNFSNLD